MVKVVTEIIKLVLAIKKADLQQIVKEAMAAFEEVAISPIKSIDELSKEQLPRTPAERLHATVVKEVTKNLRERLAEVVCVALIISVKAKRSVKTVRVDVSTMVQDVRVITLDDERSQSSLIKVVEEAVWVEDSFDSADVSVFLVSLKSGSKLALSRTVLVNQVSTPIT